jgi:hypothetical protein
MVSTDKSIEGDDKTYRFMKLQSVYQVSLSNQITIPLVVGINYQPNSQYQLIGTTNYVVLKPKELICFPLLSVVKRIQVIHLLKKNMWIYNVRMSERTPFKHQK